MDSVNSKIKTLWTISGRQVDSREVLDSNGGLLAGRIDIPASQAVKADGYSFIQYRTTLSDGSKHTATTFEEWIGAFRGTVESKSGSGIMTVFIPTNGSVGAGIFQLDVYKEWEESNPDPEPELPPSYPVRMDGVVRYLNFTSGGTTSIQFQYTTGSGSWSTSSYDGKYMGRWSINAIVQAEAADIKRLQDKLGVAGGAGFDPAPLTKRITSLEAADKSLTNRLLEVEQSDKSLRATIAAIGERLAALEKPAV